MKYEIYEENFERLCKKLKTIENKCAKYGCDFKFEVVGDTFKECKVEVAEGKYETRTLRFIVVDVDGKAIVNDWKFVASVERTEKGNIFKKACDVEIPERYYDMELVCEHCHTNHARKYAYIVTNVKTGEFKQVGKACLKDFTCGMSATMVTEYISYFNELIKGETPRVGNHFESYIEFNEAMGYIAETILKFGYTSKNAPNNTACRASAYYCADKGWEGFAIEKREMAKVGFDWTDSKATALVADALKWLGSNDNDNNYFHNLKVACSLKYVRFSHFGLLTSLFGTYHYDMEKAKEREMKKAEEEKIAKTSGFVGEIGKKVTIMVADAKCLASWETAFGTTSMYRIVDTNDNVFIWKTSTSLGNNENRYEDKLVKIVATVKAHNEFRGVKQTEITRGFKTFEASEKSKEELAKVVAHKMERYGIVGGFYREMAEKWLGMHFDEEGRKVA